MRITAVLALVAALGTAPSAVAKPKPQPKSKTPPPAAVPQIAVVHVADGWRADLAFDGSLLGWALPRTRGRQRALLLLVGPQAGDSGARGSEPCVVRDEVAKSERNARLFRWRFESPDRLEALGSGLPTGALESADLDGDGVDELLLVRAGSIELVTISSEGTAGARVLIADEEIGKSLGGPRVAWEGSAAQDPALRVGLLGAFRTYRGDPGGSAALVSELAIPLRLKAGAERVRVESPAVRPIGEAGSGRMTFATEPEPLGRRRLRTLLLDPDGPAETRVVESWALFPEPERVVDSMFAMRNGAPILIVTTTPADKLSLLGEKALRVYPLSGDRTRAGDAPLFAATTGINLWQAASSTLVDLDSDGRDDLVLAYWKGLKNAIAALEVYRGTASSFEKARSMSFDVADGQKTFMEFGADADGDGRADLIVLANRELLVIPGSAPDKAVERPVGTHPSRRIALPELPSENRMMLSAGADGFQVSRLAGGLGTPHLLDLDGDGRPEAVFAGDGEGGAGRVSIVFVRGPSLAAGMPRRFR